MQLSENFRLEEFRCKCCGEAGAINPKLVELLETIRTDTGQSVTITSGWRCKKHNAESGGASGSQHVLGNASDIKVLSYLHKYDLVAAAIRHGASGIGVADSFIHVDVREFGGRRIWTY